MKISYRKFDRYFTRLAFAVCLVGAPIFLYIAYSVERERANYSYVTGELENIECAHRKSIMTFKVFLKNYKEPYINREKIGRSADCGAEVKKLDKYLGGKVELLEKSKWIYELKINGNELINFKNVTQERYETALEYAIFLFFVSSVLLIFILRKNRRNK